ncbi:MAG: tyrosine-type recombinase/integrase [Ruminococcus sp.]|nr:tyrosine-type recombinase/integrase [Ruminococcus sp.]
MAVNPDLCFDELLEFITYQKNVKKSAELTIYNYYCDLLLFFRYMKFIKNNMPVKTKIDKIYIADIDVEFLQSITAADIQRYFDYLIYVRHLGPSTRTRRIVSLRKFFKFAHLNIEVIDKNPTDRLISPKFEKKPPEFMKEEECILLLNSIKGENHERDYCIFVLFLNTGIKLSELVALNDTDIDPLGNTVIRGKNGKKRCIVLNRACIEAIEEYRIYKEKFFGIKSYDHHAIFVGRSGKRLTDRWIEKIVKKRMNDAGFGERELSPQSLRHTAASVMYSRGVDICDLQQILGHESLGTTQIYADSHVPQGGASMPGNPLERRRTAPKIISPDNSDKK